MLRLMIWFGYHGARHILAEQRRLVAMRVAGIGC
jgi:hypothetical protein